MAAQESPFAALISQLSPPVLQEFMQCFEQVNLKKGEHLLRIGQVCRNMYLVTQGSLRHFRFSNEGVEYNTWFSFENDVVAVMESIIRHHPSKVGLIAMEDSSFMSIDKNNIDRLRQKHHEFETFSRRLIEEYFIFSDNRTFSVQSNSAIQKYRELIGLKPQVLHRVPQIHIASYLGIKKETFSRMKKKFTI